MTTTPTPATLQQRIALGLLAAAYSCDGTDCRATEDECEAAHPVRRPAPWRYVVRIEGSPEGLAAAVLAVVQPELDARDAENKRLRIAAQSAATLLRSTHDKAAVGQPLDLDTLQRAATALDDAARATTS
ncbi:hypothetical protein [Kitasatospora sp. A2-31]|uniref:hypothetical protein n=1 Tax=Kitasatospora sp. A2-31 TaxID=2916414 RepID=UPI001EE78622|nr:hypothetical protein [Kitasatospora sp. A2-31]MCG6493403.1 hypothetical protein [Kitasatospora sp. A2-31]